MIPLIQKLIFTLLVGEIHGLFKNQGDFTLGEVKGFEVAHGNLNKKGLFEKLLKNKKSLETNSYDPFYWNLEPPKKNKIIYQDYIHGKDNSFQLHDPLHYIEENEFNYKTSVQREMLSSKTQSSNECLPLRNDIAALFDKNVVNISLETELTEKTSSEMMSTFSSTIMTCDSSIQSVKKESIEKESTAKRLNSNTYSMACTAMKAIASPLFYKFACSKTPIKAYLKNTKSKLKKPKKNKKNKHTTYKVINNIFRHVTQESLLNMVVHVHCGQTEGKTHAIPQIPIFTIPITVQNVYITPNIITQSPYMPYQSYTNTINNQLISPNPYPNKYDKISQTQNVHFKTNNRNSWPQSKNLQTVNHPTRGVFDKPVSKIKLEAVSPKIDEDKNITVKKVPHPLLPKDVKLRCTTKAPVLKQLQSKTDVNLPLFLCQVKNSSCKGNKCKPLETTKIPSQKFHMLKNFTFPRMNLKKASMESSRITNALFKRLTERPPEEIAFSSESENTLPLTELQTTSTHEEDTNSMEGIFSTIMADTTYFNLETTGFSESSDITVNEVKESEEENEEEEEEKEDEEDEDAIPTNAITNAIPIVAGIQTNGSTEHTEESEYHLSVTTGRLETFPMSTQGRPNKGMGTNMSELFTLSSEGTSERKDSTIQQTLSSFLQETDSQSTDTMTGNEEAKQNTFTNTALTFLERVSLSTYPEKVGNPQGSSSITKEKSSSFYSKTSSTNIEGENTATLLQESKTFSTRFPFSEVRTETLSQSRFSQEIENTTSSMILFRNGSSSDVKAFSNTFLTGGTGISNFIQQPMSSPSPQNDSVGSIESVNVTLASKTLKNNMFQNPSKMFTRETPTNSLIFTPQVILEPSSILRMISPSTESFAFRNYSHPSNSMIELEGTDMTMTKQRQGTVSFITAEKIVKEGGGVTPQIYSADENLKITSTESTFSTRNISVNDSTTLIERNSDFSESTASLGFLSSAQQSVIQIYNNSKNSFNQSSMNFNAISLLKMGTQILPKSTTNSNIILFSEEGLVSETQSQKIKDVIDLGGNKYQFYFNDRWYITDTQNIWSFDEYTNKIMNESFFNTSKQRLYKVSEHSKLIGNLLLKNGSINASIEMPFDLLAQSIILTSKYKIVNSTFNWMNFSLSYEDIIAMLRLSDFDKFNSSQHPEEWKSLNWESVYDKVKSSEKTNFSDGYEYLTTDENNIGMLTKIVVYSNSTSIMRNKRLTLDESLKILQNLNRFRFTIPSKNHIHGTTTVMWKKENDMIKINFIIDVGGNVYQFYFNKRWYVTNKKHIWLFDNHTSTVLNESFFRITNEVLEHNNLQIKEIIQTLLMKNNSYNFSEQMPFEIFAQSILKTTSYIRENVSLSWGSISVKLTDIIGMLRLSDFNVFNSSQMGYNWGEIKWDNVFNRLRQYNIKQLSDRYEYKITDDKNQTSDLIVYFNGSSIWKGKMLTLQESLNELQNLNSYTQFSTTTINSLYESNDVSFALFIKQVLKQVTDSKTKFINYKFKDLYINYDEILALMMLINAYTSDIAKLKSLLDDEKNLEQHIKQLHSSIKQYYTDRTVFNFTVGAKSQLISIYTNGTIEYQNRKVTLEEISKPIIDLTNSDSFNSDSNNIYHLISLGGGNYQFYWRGKWFITDQRHIWPFEDETSKLMNETFFNIKEENITNKKKFAEKLLSKIKLLNNETQERMPFELFSQSLLTAKGSTQLNVLYRWGNYLVSYGEILAMLRLSNFDRMFNSSNWNETSWDSLYKEIKQVETKRFSDRYEYKVVGERNEIIPMVIYLNGSSVWKGKKIDPRESLTALQNLNSNTVFSTGTINLTYSSDAVSLLSFIQEIITKQADTKTKYISYRFRNLNVDFDDILTLLTFVNFTSNDIKTLNSLLSEEKLESYLNQILIMKKYYYAGYKVYYGINIEPITVFNNGTTLYNNRTVVIEEISKRAKEIPNLDLAVHAFNDIQHIMALGDGKYQFYWEGKWYVSDQDHIWPFEDETSKLMNETFFSVKVENITNKTIIAEMLLSKVKLLNNQTKERMPFELFSQSLLNAKTFTTSDVVYKWGNYSVTYADIIAMLRLSNFGMFNSTYWRKSMWDWDSLYKEIKQFYIKKLSDRYVYNIVEVNKMKTISVYFNGSSVWEGKKLDSQESLTALRNHSSNSVLLTTKINYSYSSPTKSLLSFIKEIIRQQIYSKTKYKSYIFKSLNFHFEDILALLAFINITYSDLKTLETTLSEENLESYLRQVLSSNREYYDDHRVYHMGLNSKPIIIFTNETIIYGNKGMTVEEMYKRLQGLPSFDMPPSYAYTDVQHIISLGGWNYQFYWEGRWYVTDQNHTWPFENYTNENLNKSFFHIKEDNKLDQNIIDNLSYNVKLTHLQPQRLMPFELFCQSLFPAIDFNEFSTLEADYYVWRNRKLSVAYMITMFRIIKFDEFNPLHWGEINWYNLYKNVSISQQTDKVENKFMLEIRYSNKFRDDENYNILFYDNGTSIWKNKILHYQQIITILQNLNSHTIFPSNIIHIQYESQTASLLSFIKEIITQRADSDTMYTSYRFKKLVFEFDDILAILALVDIINSNIDKLKTTLDEKRLTFYLTRFESESGYHEYYAYHRVYQFRRSKSNRDSDFIPITIFNNGTIFHVNRRVTLEEVSKKLKDLPISINQELSKNLTTYQDLLHFTPNFTLY